MVTSSLYSIFSSIFVGKFLGTTAFAALNLAMPLVIINFALSEMVGVGSSVPISIFLGKKEDDKANNYFTASILLVMLTGALSGALIFIGAPAFMRLMGAEGELLDLAVQYTRICAIFSPITLLSFSLDNYLRISGKLNASMFLNIFSSVLTVVMEFLLIIVFPMGITGVALGTSGAMIICVAIGIGMFLPGKLQLKFVRPHFSKGMFVQIYKNGISPFLTNISGRIFSVVMNILLLKFGGEAAVAIYGIIMILAGIIEQLMYGVIDSLQPALGYNYGAQRFDRVKQLEKYILITAATISLMGGLVLFVFPEAVSVPFLEDWSLLSMAIVAVQISSFTFLSKWFGIAIQCFFMALEMPLLALVLSTASACVFPLLLIPVLFPLELTGLWWNYPITSFMTAVLAIIILLKVRKKLFVISK